MSDIFNKISKELHHHNLRISESDTERPWGGFFVIHERDSQKFADIYFDGLSTDNLKVSGKLSPKILVIAPDKRLSWQYHHRRSEIWQVHSGSIKVITSHDDTEREETTLKGRERIELYQGQRHRIVGTDDYAIVAEIWIHTDVDNPSDENDIVRVQDDFNRK